MSSIKMKIEIIENCDGTYTAKYEGHKLTHHSKKAAKYFLLQRLYELGLYKPRPVKMGPKYEIGDTVFVPMMHSDGIVTGVRPCDHGPYTKFEYYINDEWHREQHIGPKRRVKKTRVIR